MAEEKEMMMETSGTTYNRGCCLKYGVIVGVIGFGLFSNIAVMLIVSHKTVPQNNVTEGIILKSGM